MLTQAEYIYLGLAAALQLVGAAYVKRLHPAVDRPTSDMGLFALAFCELSAGMLIWWGVREALGAWKALALTGIIGIYIVDLVYLTQLRKQPLAHGAKRAAILTLTTGGVVLLIRVAWFAAIIVSALTGGTP